MAPAPPAPQSKKSICPAPEPGALKMSRPDSIDRSRGPDQKLQAARDRLPYLSRWEIQSNARAFDVCMYICTARSGGDDDLNYKKQEDDAMVAAILWRKKLVLHRSLVEIFIGVSDNPIMNTPIPISREISSAARGGDHSPDE
ncbi:hypothetical protein ABZP36_022558 [Zizania latifolia]